MLMSSPGRESNLERARSEYGRFLKLLESYDLLSKEDETSFERYFENPDQFSTTPSKDAAERRQTKIASFKKERALKLKLQVP